MNLDLNVLGYRFVEACLRNYQGTCMLIGLFIIALLYVFIDGEKRWKAFFIPYVAILLLTVFNPFIMRPVVAKLKLTNEYYRFFWLLPIVILLSYTATKIVIGLGKLWRRILVASVLVFMMFLTGTTLRSKAYPVISNIYKVPEDLVEICDMIHENNDMWTVPNVAFDFDLNILATQYDPSINAIIPYELMMSTVNSQATENTDDADWTRMRVRLIEALMLDRPIEIYSFMEALNITKTQYVVYRQDGPMHSYISGAGFDYVGETENYVVYRYSYAKPEDYLEPWEIELQNGQSVSGSDEEN
jgi:hypothetical protein